MLLDERQHGGGRSQNAQDGGLYDGFCGVGSQPVPR